MNDWIEVAVRLGGALEVVAVCAGAVLAWVRLSNPTD